MEIIDNMVRAIVDLLIGNKLTGFTAGIFYILKNRNFVRNCFRP